MPGIFYRVVASRIPTQLTSKARIVHRDSLRARSRLRLQVSRETESAVRKDRSRARPSTLS